MRGGPAACGTLAAFIFAATGYAPTAAEAQTLPEGFRDTIAFEWLTWPTAVRFLPDGRVFVVERPGRIKVFDGLYDPTPTLFADLRNRVYDFGERGLLGLELGPNFEVSPYVYVLYTLDALPGGFAPYWNDSCPTPPGPTTDGCVASARLARIRAAGNVAAGPEEVLLEGWCQQFPSHTIGSLAFDSHGALYVSSGDAAGYTFVDHGQRGVPPNPCGDPTGEGGALRSQDLRTTGDPTGFDGSLLRLDPDTGEPVPTNPLFSSPDPNARRIVAHGFRNPFRFTIRPGTREVWVGDVGWMDADEINRIPDAADLTVENFGWPCYEGTSRQPSYDAADLSLCEDLYEDEDAVARPAFSYGRAEDIVPGETCPDGMTISALEFYEGGAYPEAYEGALFFADLSRSCIWVVFPGPGGEPDFATREVFMTGSSMVVDLQAGPGGDLFYVDHLGAIRRLEYTASNHPPSAVIEADATSGEVPLTVQFDAGFSTDADADPLTFAWDLDGDGELDDSNDAAPSWVYDVRGAYTVRLRAQDAYGQSDYASITIAAGESRPTAEIEAPSPGSFTWRTAETIAFTGQAADAEDGPLPAGVLSWMLVLHHCPTTCHEHVLESRSGVANGSFSAPDHDYPSYLEIRLEATDSSGLTDEASVTIQPEVVEVTFASEPAGLVLAVDDRAETTPFTRRLIVGATTSISAPAQEADGVLYVLESWSDGGRPSHELAAPETATTVTAVLTPNDPPIGNIRVIPISGRSPLTVTFDATLSRDPDPWDSFSYAWDLDGDGVFDDATSSTVTRTYDSIGRHDVSVRLTDNHGSSSTASARAIVENGLPTARVLASATRGAAPLAVAFDASGSNEPDAGDSLSYAWDLDGDKVFDDGVGPSAKRVFTAPGTFRIRVRATDRHGGFDDGEAVVRVQGFRPLLQLVQLDVNRRNGGFFALLRFRACDDSRAHLLIHRQELVGDPAAPGALSSRSFYRYLRGTEARCRRCELTWRLPPGFRAGWRYQLVVRLADAQLNWSAAVARSEEL